MRGVMEGGGLCVLVDQDSINETEAPTCFQCQWHSSGMASVYMPPRQRGPILGEDGRNGRRRKQAGESSVEIHEKEHPNVSTNRKHNRSQSDKLRKVMLGHFIQISPSASCSSSPQPCFPLGYFFFHRSSRLPI